MTTTKEHLPAITTQVPEYLTIAEAARLLHRKPYPLSAAIYSGELRASLPGGDGAWLIDPADLRAYVDKYAHNCADVTA